MRLIILLIIGIWIGMVLGISFLEAPLKFQAPNMTLSLGLGIGKLVFSALNKIEIIFSVITFIWLVVNFNKLTWLAKGSILFVLIIVLIQSLYLLPILNARVEQILQGNEVEKTPHHLYFVFLEILKVISLIFSFIKIYRI